VLIATIAIDTNVICQPAIACGAKGLDGKDIAFLHALVCLGLDERDLLVTVNLVAKDVVASDVLNCFDGNGLAAEFDLVALHYLLDILADLVNPGVDASFLRQLSLRTHIYNESAYLKPGIGGFLDSSK
jgi:hypothetical protein